MLSMIKPINAMGQRTRIVYGIASPTVSTNATTPKSAPMKNIAQASFPASFSNIVLPSLRGQ
jgi:hypothetical protein